MASFSFPEALLGHVRCTVDAGALAVDARSRRCRSGGIHDGHLECTSCGRRYPVEEGILNLMLDEPDDEESRHERRQREAFALQDEATPDYATDDDRDAMERPSTIDAMELDRRMTVLELGCGDGRFTCRIAGACQALLAVDFSANALRKLRSRLKAHTNLGLVVADVAQLKLAPRTFDRALSTLVSNLPSMAIREAMYRLVASSLKLDGQFLFSTHHYGIRQRLRCEKRSGRYSEGGIYRYQFSEGECRKEAHPFFKRIDITPIRIRIPFARTLGISSVRLSRSLEGVPIVGLLGELLLCTASSPRI